MPRSLKKLWFLCVVMAWKDSGVHIVWVLLLVVKSLAHRKGDVQTSVGNLALWSFQLSDYVSGTCSFIRCKGVWGRTPTPFSCHL